MKLFKTFAATAAVAAVVMLSSCQDITEATEEELADAQITKKSIELFNTYDASGASGLDAVKGEGVLGHNVKEDEAGVGIYKGYKWGDIAYTTEGDSDRIDFKSLNSNGRTTLTTKLISVNNTKYAVVDADEFAAVTKSIRRFKDKLKDIADTASADTIMYSEESPYFVAKLGNDRGYCLAKVTAIDPTFVNDSPSNTGRAAIDYYYISADSLSKYSN